jgi:hypothetical protein
VRSISSLAFTFLFIATLCPTLSSASEPAPTHLETITLERTPCYGPCPVYSVEIKRDGMVNYFGEEYVKVKGKKTARIKAADFTALEAKFQKIDFLSLRNTYIEKEDGCTEVWTDSPSMHITAKYSNVQRKVRYYMGCIGLPILEDIAHLARAIDDTAGTSKWIGK